jgi:8-oxo-dGTP pyrophosphatase MutT (NUDIX family)
VQSPFKSRPSPSHVLADGRLIYESRSVAVTAVVLAYDAAERAHYVVVGERGTGVDLSGLHCLVCGYLDWDESLPDAVRREVFEETSKHVAVGMKYLPAIARRLHHCRDLGSDEPFDFLTLFDFAAEHAPAFEDLVAALRASHEWTFVEREFDIRMVRAT